MKKKADIVLGAFFILFSIVIGEAQVVPDIHKNLKDEKENPSLSLLLEPGSYNFFVIGDWGRLGENNQAEVAEGMRKIAKTAKPEFIISTGDNFYTNGVAGVLDPHWTQSYENIYGGMDLNVNWYPILGNHDYQGNPQAEIDYSKVSRKWNMPSRYYSFVQKADDGKKIRLIFLDTNPFVEKYYENPDKYSDLSKQDTLKQLKWLDSLLVNSKEEWKIVIGHHPIYSSSKKHGDTKELIQKLKPRLDKYGIQAYFCGHDHDLQHQRPTGKVDYFVSGAGSDVRVKDVSSTEYTKFAKAIPGFALVSIKGNLLTLYYINNYGEVLYKYKREVN